MDSLRSLFFPGTGAALFHVLLWCPLLALAVDWWLGEPPVAWHPVVWMGKALQWWGDRLAPTAPVARDIKLFWRSALVWCALVAIVLIVSGLAQHLVLMLHGFLAAALLALLLKPLLAWRMLHDEVLAVELALGQSLPAGRSLLTRLTEWCAQKQFTYSHEWQDGDFVVWNNCGVMHRVVPYEEDSGRMMHRTTIMGSERLGHAYKAVQAA